jgi:hypothetical protein
MDVKGHSTALDALITGNEQVAERTPHLDAYRGALYHARQKLRDLAATEPPAEGKVTDPASAAK